MNEDLKVSIADHEQNITKVELKSYVVKKIDEIYPNIKQKIGPIDNFIK